MSPFFTECVAFRTLKWNCKTWYEMKSVENTNDYIDVCSSILTSRDLSTAPRQTLCDCQLVQGPGDKHIVYLIMRNSQRHTLTSHVMQLIHTQPVLPVFPFKTPILGTWLANTALLVSMLFSLKRSACNCYDYCSHPCGWTCSAHWTIVRNTF